MSTDSIEGGKSGSHPSAWRRPGPVAHNSGSESNTLRMRLIPVACWKINVVRIEFGSSFVLPDSAGEFRELARQRTEHPGVPLTVFGHADPVSKDDFNKQLSGRRAETV